MVSGIPKLWNPKGFFRVLFKMFLTQYLLKELSFFHLFSAKISSSSLPHQDKTGISTLLTKPWNVGLALVWFLGSLECFEHRDTKLFISAGWAMIFQTITSLTYAVLLNTESLSLSEKQQGPLFKDNDLESVGWAAAPQPQAHPSPGAHNHLLSAASPRRFLPPSRTYHGPGIGSWEAVWTSVTGGQNCLWRPLATHRKFNPQKIQPVYFMSWSRMAWESHKVRSVTY